MRCATLCYSIFTIITFTGALTYSVTSGDVAVMFDNPARMRTHVLLLCNDVVPVWPVCVCVECSPGMDMHEADGQTHGPPGALTIPVTITQAQHSTHRNVCRREFRTTGYCAHNVDDISWRRLLLLQRRWL